MKKLLAGLLVMMVLSVIAIFVWQRKQVDSCSKSGVISVEGAQGCGYLRSSEEVDWYVGKVIGFEKNDQFVAMDVDLGLTNQKFNVGYLDLSRFLVAKFSNETEQSFGEEDLKNINEMVIPELNSQIAGKYIVFFVTNGSGMKNRQTRLLDISVSQDRPVDTKRLATNELSYWDKCSDSPEKLKSVFLKFEKVSSPVIEANCYPPVGTIYVVEK